MSTLCVVDHFLLFLTTFDIQLCVTVHHVPKCMSCHNIYIYIYIYMYIYIYTHILHWYCFCKTWELSLSWITYDNFMYVDIYITYIIHLHILCILYIILIYFINIYYMRMYSIVLSILVMRSDILWDSPEAVSVLVIRRVALLLNIPLRSWVALQEKKGWVGKKRVFPSIHFLNPRTQLNIGKYEP